MTKDEASRVSEAVAYAVSVHKDMLYAGQPYIFHPIRVMLAVETKTEKIEVIQAAVLHDSIEDVGKSPLKRQVQKKSLGLVFQARVVHLVDILTRGIDETYEDYILRVKKDDDARLIKLADINDNLSFAQILKPKQRDKYLKALDVLTDGGTCW